MERARRREGVHACARSSKINATGKTIPFGRKDDGGDLVETSYLFEGLLCARQYFDGNWAKAYAFADGHSEIHSARSDDFESFEKKHIIPPPNP